MDCHQQRSHHQRTPMTQAQIEEAAFNAEQTLTLMHSREAEAINDLRSAMLATLDAEQALADARALVPDPVPDPEPGLTLAVVTPLPAPEIINNNDGTFTVPAHPDALTEVWLWEASTNGWQSIAGAGVAGDYTAEHQGRNVMASYFLAGPGGEHTEDGPRAILVIA